MVVVVLEVVSISALFFALKTNYKKRKETKSSILEPSPQELISSINNISYSGYLR